MSLAGQTTVALGALAAVTVLAIVAGAANLGIALSFGTIAFAIAVVVMLMRN